MVANGWIDNLAFWFCCLHANTTGSQLMLLLVGVHYYQIQLDTSNVAIWVLGLFVYKHYWDIKCLNYGWKVQCIIVPQLQLMLDGYGTLEVLTILGLK